MQRYRPAYPRINMRAPLANGLVFAGLGGGASTVTYLDSSPYGNHGTLTSMDPATDWVWDGTLGRWTVAFAAGTQRILTTSLWYNIDVTNLTVCFWMYHPAVTADQGLFYHANHGATMSCGMWLDDAATDHIQFIVTDSAAHTSGLLDVSTFVPLASTWTHVALSFVGGLNTRLYINGIEDGASPFATSAVLNIAAGTAGWSLGNSADGVKDFLGSMADWCIWDRRLSTAEIQQLADPSNVMLSGLILPPRRRIWAVSGGAPPTNYLLTLRAANKRGNKLGGTLVGKQA